MPFTSRKSVSSSALLLASSARISTRAPVRRMASTSAVPSDEGAVRLTNTRFRTPRPIIQLATRSPERAESPRD